MRFFQLFSQSPILAIIFILVMVAALTVHEFAHAWTADRLGDPTPGLDGRVTLNPAAHLDPLGSLAFLIFGFGWGKPVVYNPMYLKRHSDELLVALAGPASNLVFALLLNLLSLVTRPYLAGLDQILGFASDINILLASFNIIPIPPLDGSSLVAYFWPEYRQIGRQFGFIAVLLLIYIPIPGHGSLLSLLMDPIRTFFTSLTHLFGLI
jgi:Zn-dependent protease